MKLLNKLLGKKEAKAKKKTCLVVGHLGQVGSAIYKILKEAKFIVDGFDLEWGKIEAVPFYDIMHICIGFKSHKQYFQAVKKLNKEFCPRAIIIHSSVLPGTTNKLYKELDVPICYSPIRGQHDNLKADILKYYKYFSPLPLSSSDFFLNHFTDMKLKVVGYNKTPDELELVKLLDVCQYGILIGWAQETERILKKNNFNYSLLQHFQAEHQEFHPEKRADITPGIIGGNCVIQDAELILKIYKSQMLKELLKSNEKRKKKE